MTPHTLEELPLKIKHIHMKLHFITLLLCSCSVLCAQTKLEESIDAGGINTIKLDFRWPELVKLSSWAGDAVKITGRVSINNGEHDEAFKIRTSRSQGTLMVFSEIENIEELPEMIAIKKGGVMHYFSTDNWHDPQVQEFLQGDNENGHQYTSKGVIKEIELEVWLPEKVSNIIVEAKYGLLEVTDLKNNLDANSKYGGIDIAIAGQQRSIKAKTKFGQIYSNLPYDFKSEGGEVLDYGKWIVINAEGVGGQGSLILESKYGNIYLRREEVE